MRDWKDTDKAYAESKQREAQREAHIHALKSAKESQARDLKEHALPHWGDGKGNVK